MANGISMISKVNSIKENVKTNAAVAMIEC